MPRLEQFHIKIKTGKRPLNEKPRYVINGFALEFDEQSGGTDSGQTLEATGSPESFPHTLLLCGPEEGTWDIEQIEATYYPRAEEPYTLRFDRVTLDSESDLNLWHPRPGPVYEV